MDGLARLARESPQARFVGWAVAEVAGDDLAPELLSWLGRQDKRGELASAWAVRIAETHGSEWITATAARIDAFSAEAQTAFLRALPSGADLERLLDVVDPLIREAYWRSINPLLFLDEERLGFGVEHLVAHGRAAAAVDLLATGLHDGKALPSGVTLEVIAQALQAALSAEVDASRVPFLSYEVGSVLDRLEQLGAEDHVLVQLEWAYFQLLEHSRPARALYRALGQDPAFFVDLVCRVYRGKNERRRQLDDEAALRARNAWSVLDAWRQQDG